VSFNAAAPRLKKILACGKTMRQVCGGSTKASDSTLMDGASVILGLHGWAIRRYFGLFVRLPRIGEELY